jgi:hypothetical protein
MSAWLDPVRLALAAAPAPVTMYFRDDDAGWDDEALYRLLEVFMVFQVPIALAAIPTAVSARLAAELRMLLAVPSPGVSVHQHGFAHVNHETGRRKCEFGQSRPRDRQCQDLANGKERLQQALGCQLPPIFTPPWNRCTRDTAECLVDLGFTILSRDASAEGFGIDALHELPVHLDWSGRHGVGTGPEHWAATIARTIAGRHLVGVMLHHAVMNADDRGMLRDLLGVLANGPAVRLRPMLHNMTASTISGGISSCAS